MEKRIVHPATLEAELTARLAAPPPQAHKKRGRRRSRRPAFLVLTALMSMLVLGVGSVGATITSEFEITDANVIDDAPPAPDWDTILGPGNVVAAGAPDPTEFLVDPLAGDPLPCGGTGDPTVFTGAGGEKNGDAFNTMTWGAGSIPNNKDDLSNIYIHGQNVDHDGDATTPEHFVIYFGAERVATNGASHIDLEFLQAQVGLVVTGQDAAGCDSGIWSGTRTIGDILITINFTIGGTLGIPEFRVWDGDSYEVAAVAGGSAGVVSNTVDIDCGDWTCRDTDGDATDTLIAQAFVEGFLDTDDPAINLGGCLTSFNAHTRSAPPITATLKDFVLGSFATCDLAVEKTGGTISKVGDAVSYTITIENTGIVPLFKEDISDTLLGAITVNGVDQVNPLITSNTCGASLAPGASCTITASRVVQAGDADPLPNTVTVVYDSEAGFLGDDVTRTDDHSVNLFAPAVTIDKTGNATSKVGDPVDYVITVNNTSSADTPNLVCNVTDTLLGTVENGLNLASGASKVYNITRNVAGGDPDPLVNTASVTCSPVGFPNVVSDTDGHSVNTFGPSVTILKTGDTLSKIGDSVDYTITVTNTSSADTPNLVCTVTDSLLGTISSNFNLASGANVVFNRTRTVVAADPDPLVNTASVTCSPVGFPNVINASDGHTVNLFQPSITFEKTGDTLSKVGDAVDYTITVTNTSSADTPNLVCNVSDSLLGTIQNGVNLSSGSTATFNRSRTVVGGDPDPLVNTASVTCSPTGFPNVLSTSDGHSVNLFQPSVTINKTGPAFTKATDVNDYVITVSNTSSADTPALTCNVIDTLLGTIQNGVVLNPGQNAVFNRTRTTLASDPDPLVNTASATCSPAGFPNVLSVSEGHSSDVLHPAFTFTKTCLSTQPVPQEGPATFRVTLTNTGDADLVFNVDDGIGTVNLAAGATQNFNVVANGPFSGQTTVSNTANATVTLDPKYELSNSFTATATASCRIGSRVEVEKTVNGLIDSTLDLKFAIYAGADGFDSGSPALATDSTLGDADGVLEFGLLNLDPLLTYTVCELDTPAGWTSVWTVNAVDVTALVYNPDADNPIPEDLGNRCLDFGAGTTIPLTAGGTLRFVVDNQVPQGDARTPGYWKNWNTCTGGRQAENAAKNGGSAAGFWLLDDLLPQTIGDLTITTCEDGVAILDSRDLNTNKKLANDACYTLARALLAAQLNVGAGAAHSGDVDDAIAEGNLLLADVDFDATGACLGPKVKGAQAALRADALAIAGYLDDYNNNLALPPYPGYYP
jgi:uncharacterized repeat protein (TIGR01451 family)